MILRNLFLLRETGRATCVKFAQQVPSIAGCIGLLYLALLQLSRRLLPMLLASQDIQQKDGGCGKASRDGTSIPEHDV